MVALGADVLVAIAQTRRTYGFRAPRAGAAMSDMRHERKRSECRRWFLRHPVELALRSLSWWRRTGMPPWKQSWLGLTFIDPAPPDKYVLAGLMTKPKDDQVDEQEPR